MLLAYRRTENEQQRLAAELSRHPHLFLQPQPLHRGLRRVFKKSGPIGAVYLDVNGLKDTNDQYGHAAGDRCW